MSSFRVGRLVLFACSLSFGGCKSEPKIAEPTASTSAAVPAEVTPAASPAPAADETLLNELEQRGKTCEAVAGEGRVRCAGGGNWAMVGEFLEKRRDRSASVATMARALEHEQPGVRGLTVAVLNGAFATLWGREPAPGPVAPAAADALLQNTLRLPPELVTKALPAAVNASMLAGRGEALLAELAKPERAALRATAYPNLMTFGRLNAFGEIRKVVAAPDQVLALAALDAPINMEAWSDAEEQAICGWAEGLQADPRVMLKPKVDLILGHCSGARLDQLLARAEKLTNEARLDMESQQALVAMCNRVRRPVLRATEQQCNRARVLFVKTAENKTAAAKDRAHAINWIARLWPDAKSKALMDQLKLEPDANLARQADEGLKWIAASNETQPAAVSAH